MRIRPADVDARGTFVADSELKRDLFGSIERGHWREDGPAVPAIRRDTAASPWWIRPVARWLLRRELSALHVLAGAGDDAGLGPCLPALLQSDARSLVRSWIPGLAMQEARPAEREYFRAARRLLVRLHRIGIAHNDLAKEPNWLVTAEGAPALVDLQLATVSRRRSRCFRLAAREDLRHLLKHKRTYCPEHLTASERRLLASPSGPARLLRAGMKPIYNGITRGLLGWSDREGGR